MPYYCCVPGCQNAKGGHLFPTDTKDLLKWRVAVKRCDPKTKKLWSPDLSRDRVCSAHFLPTDYVAGRSQKILKKGAVPSVFKHRKPMSKPTSRKKLTYQTTGLQQPECSTSDNLHCDQVSEENTSANVGIQCQLTIHTSIFDFKRFMHDRKGLQYLTGFDGFHQFMFFKEIVMHDLNSLEYKCSILSEVDQLFLTLVKLRQALDHQLLSYMFGVSEATVSKIFSSWVKHMYHILKKIPIWPSKQTVVDTMPEEFKKEYPSTRVIIDCTEIPIEKPSGVKEQSMTFSTYKNRNTIKVLIGITPKGTVSYIGDCYGGAASDRYIIMQSHLYTKASVLFEKRDSIMADKGFQIQDLFTDHDIQINTPSFMRGKTRLPQGARLDDFTVSSLRVHVERVIGYAKTFKIIDKVLPYGLLPLSNKIVFLCFMMLNFRKEIV